LTNPALVCHAAVLTAGAFPVNFRTEDPLAEQAVLFGSKGAVIDGFGFLDFAEGPAANVVRAGQPDAHRTVIVDPIEIDVAGVHKRFRIRWISGFGRRKYCYFNYAI